MRHRIDFVGLFLTLTVFFIAVRIFVIRRTPHHSVTAAVVEKLDAGAPSIMTSGGPVIEQLAPPIAPAPAKKLGQDEAIDLVWRDLYEMTCAPPTIIWVEESGLDCGTGKTPDGKIIGGHKNNGFHGWIDFNVTDGWPPCVCGTFSPDTYSILLAWPRGTTKFSTTALAHELFHAKKWRDTGEINHEGIGFAPRGTIYRADRALRKHGL